MDIKKPDAYDLYHKKREESMYPNPVYSELMVQKQMELETARILKIKQLETVIRMVAQYNIRILTGGK
jgi:hypothetical protein